MGEMFSYSSVHMDEGYIAVCLILIKRTLVIFIFRKNVISNNSLLLIVSANRIQFTKPRHGQ